MINKMDRRSGEMAGTTDTLATTKNDLSGTNNTEPVGDPIPDSEKFVKEKNLLVLSALYYLYGEDWKEPPDWLKVSEKIQESKIPVYGDDLSSEVCEKLYKGMMENGIQLGLDDVTVVIKPPKRFNDSEKRLWMIAQITTDIVRVSKVMERKMENNYKTQMRIMELIASGELITEEVFEKEFRLTSQDDDASDDDDSQFSDEFEDPDADIAATQLWQLEVMEKIVGMKDVLLLIKYCNAAAEYAVMKYESLMKPPAVTPAPPKPLDSNRTYIILDSSDDDSIKLISPIKGTKPLHLETITIRPEGPPPEVSGKQPDGSPQKQSSKPATRSNSRDNTPVDFVSPVKEPKEAGDTSSPSNSLPVNGGSPASTTSTINLSGNSSFAEPNGGEITVLDEKVQESLNKSDSSIEIIEEVIPYRRVNINTPGSSNVVAVVDLNVSLNDIGAKGKAKEANKLDAAKEPESAKEPVPIKEPVSVKESEPSKESELVNESDPAKEPEPTKELGTDKEMETVAVRGKGRASTRKSVGATRKGSKRAYYRLATPSPEPNDTAQNDDDKISKRTRGRHSSSSDTTPPVLPPIRRPRVAIPNMPVVEKEPPKVVTGNSKSDVVPVESSDTETLETPRTTPESPEMKTVEPDNNQDVRPKTQRVKTYSAKPPSPLSHVDPKIFDEFMDDEDDPELAMIDNNLNKTKGDKVSPTKTTPRRGRTVSSENTSENNEDISPSKRITRRGAPNDDTEETPESTGQSSDDKSKRLTRSSLKVHDAANDEGTEPSSRTGSEKAASESSFGGKDKNSTRPKSMGRVKKVDEKEKSRVSGEDEDEKTADGKRVTRARAKTGPSTSETTPTRTKPSTTEPEGVNENDPSPPRATRSRVSTGTASIQPEPAAVVTSMPAPSDVSDDEDSKLFRKNALAIVEKVSTGEAGSSIKKFMDDPEEIVKQPIGFNEIKQKIESGKIKSLSALKVDLNLMGMNVMFSYPSSSQAKEALDGFCKLIFDGQDLNELKHPRCSSSHKIDNSDVESLESHDESRGDVTPKSVVSTAMRRKRRRSASETSEEVFPQENKRRITRTSVSSTYTPTSSRKPKHPISPDIVSANRVRH